VSLRVDNAANWTVGAVQGPDVFTLGWGQTDTMGVKPLFTRMQTVDQVLVSGLNTSETMYFDLELGLPIPSSTTDQQQILVTLTASTPVGFVYSLTGDFWAKNMGIGAWSSDWSDASTHTISQAEWEYMVMDGLFILGNNGWTPDSYGGTSKWMWQVTDVPSAVTWHYTIDHESHARERWVILD